MACAIQGSRRKKRVLLMESNAERILLDVMAGERAARRGETNSWAQEGHSDESVAASLGMEDQLPDEELVRRYRSGDRAALELLVRRHESRVYSIAYQMTGRREDALDLVQEIFLRVIQALPRFQGRSAFRTWLYRVASFNGTARGSRYHVRSQGEALFCPTGDRRYA